MPIKSQNDAAAALTGALGSPADWSAFHEIPPDAGDSVLGTFGLKSWLATWLLMRAPELLAMTPRQLRDGLRPPICPELYCRMRMVLRVAEAEGRRVERLVWRCYRHRSRPYKAPEGWQPYTPEREVDLLGMPRPKVRLNEILAATRRGATVDYQRRTAFTDPELIVQEPKRKRRSR